MTASVRSIVAALLLLLANAAVAQGRYRITLNLAPHDDSAEAARQIEAMTRGRIEAGVEDDSGTFVLVASEAAIGTIRQYPRVAQIEELGRAVGADASPATWTTGTYAYDDAGNVKSITRSDFTEQYVYDAFGRLTSGTAGPGRSQSYTYDRFGNILTLTTDGSLIRLGVNSATNRMNATGSQYNITATYDGAGRMTAVPALGYNFSYDGLDTVTESTIGERRVHLYTANDERVASVSIVNNVPSTWNWTIRDPSGKVLRRFTKPAGGTLTWTEDYIYRDAQMLAAEVAAPERRRHFHPDHLGTPRLITGSGGTQIGLHTYFPFGAETTQPQEGERKKFTGHERDNPNLDYMHARYYGVAWGRFLSVDPTWESADLGKPQSWNRYAYVMNNPVNMTDPDGKCPVCSPDNLVDAVSAAWGIGSIWKKALNGEPVTWRDNAAVAVDIGSAFIPGLTGGGTAIRAAAKADDVIDAAKGAGSVGRLLPFKDADRITEVNKTLDRIKDGVQKYKQDGTMFKNAEGKLPEKPAGYYKEYTVDTPGASNRGARRIVQGKNGETYYTDDHYKSFVKIDPKVY